MDTMMKCLVVEDVVPSSSDDTRVSAYMYLSSTVMVASSMVAISMPTLSATKITKMTTAAKPLLFTCYHLTF